MPRSLYTVSAWGDDCPVWLDDSAAQRPVLLIALFWNRVLNTILITRQSVTACFVVALIFAGLRPLRSEDATLLQQEDTRNSLQVLYDFRGIQGKRIPDRSGKFPALDLQVEKMDQVELGDGVLAIRGATKIVSKVPAKRLVKAIQRTGAITIEAWLQPRTLQQDGPARILTFSKDSGARNFTLGQAGGSIQVRLRTSKTSSNGIPAVTSKSRSLKQELTHVVYTRDRAGSVSIYINGRLSQRERVAGDLSGWSDQYRLAIGNELSGDRPWLGDLHWVAVYSRAWALSEVIARHAKGPIDGSHGPLEFAVDTRPEFFETTIAPILSNHCLECHDAASQKGGLDLSHKDMAFRGGESGKAIMAGQAADSLLWLSIDSDEMPHDRPALSSVQKQALKKWIDEGAVWNVDFVDPAIYRHVRQSGNWVQRLTIPEYVATVKAIFDIDVAKEAAERLPKDQRADGFRNTAYNLSVDLKHVEAYAQMAALIVDQIDAVQFARRFGKSRRLTDDNMRQLIAKLGRWVLRAPLTEKEIALYRGISTTVASAGGDFGESVEMILEAMLQSPRFLYRIENQLGDGTRWPVSDYELASRISFIVCGSAPDDVLLNVADSGQLSDPDEVRRQVQRLLATLEARAQSEQFIIQWLDLDRLRNMMPDRKRFPDWHDSLADDMRQETIDFFMDLVWEQKRSLSDLLNAQFTYLTPRLAKHYGITAAGPGTRRYDLNDIPSRGGLLTQASVLTMGGDDASMVARGLFVLSDLLFSEVGDPPPGLDITPVPTSPGKTHRVIATGRIESESCGGCHSRFEPLAFGLERYNGVGVFQTVDQHGNSLRQDGEILFPGDAKSTAYKTSAEMMDLLAGSSRVKECLTRKVTQFLLGRPLDLTDAHGLRKIHEMSQKNGGTYQSLVTAIVLSDLVRTTQTEPELDQ